MNVEERLLLPKRLLAKAFGISTAALDRWDIKPHKKRGRESLYYLPDVIKWRLNRDTKEALDLNVERARLAKAQADRTEFDLKISRGEYVNKDEAGGLLETVVMAIRAKLLSLPTKTAPLVTGVKKLPEARDILDGATHEILAELSGLDIAGTAINRKTKAVRTSAKANGKPVGGRKQKVKPGIKRGAGAMANRKS